MRKVYFCYVLFACGWLLSRPAAAQVLWTRLVNTPILQETGKFMTPVTGGFVTVGDASQTSLYLSKINYAGDTVWTRQLPFGRGTGIYPLGGYARGVIEDRAGNLVVSATVFDSNFVPSRFWGKLAKLNPTGDTLWTRVTGAGSNALVLGKDDSYVMASDVSNNPMPTLPTLYKYSPAGALVWSRALRYSAAVPGYLADITAVPNGYILQSLPNSGGLPGKLITVNEQGVYQLDRPTSRSGIGPLRLDSDGNLVTGGRGLTKYTVIGDTIWHRPYRLGNSPSQGITQVTELPNGHYLTVGSWDNGYDKDMSLQLFSHQGNLLRDTLLFRFGANEIPVGVGYTPAGNYVVAASVDTYLINNPRPIYAQLWAGLRSWSRLLPARPGQPVPQARLLAYPNPTTDEVTLAAADAHPLHGRWVLTDLLGRTVLTGTLPGLASSRISLAAQPPGVYQLRVIDERRNTTELVRLEKQ